MRHMNYRDLANAGTARWFSNAVAVIRKELPHKNFLMIRSGDISRPNSKWKKNSDSVNQNRHRQIIIVNQ